MGRAGSTDVGCAMESRRRTGSVLAAVLAAISALAVLVAGGASPATAAGTVPSTVTVTSTVNPSVYGQTINVTAKVTGGSGTPTGSVTFVDGSTTKSKTLDASGVGTWSTSFSVGTHSITASYAGDPVYAASTSAPYAQVSNQTPTSTTLTPSANPVAFGSPVTLTAFVAASAPGNGSPSSGSVKFYDGATQIGSGTPSSGTVTLVVSNLTAGTHNLTASFGGSTSYLASTSTVLPLVVGTTATTTTLVASANPAPLGASVTFTAAVAAGAGTPTGTVTFLDGTTTLGTGTLASGQAGITVPDLAVGSHAVTAVYAGAGGFSGSTSAVLNEQIDAGPTTTTLSASPNPAAPGATVTLTATVAGGSGSPTGTVTFLDGATVLGTGTLSAGQATLATSALTVGDHALSAQYGGSPVDAASTSATVTETVATLSASATTLAAAPNPAALGAPVTLTATVSGSSGTPTGTVTFRDGATVLGTGTLAAGQASLVTSALAGGTHPLTAAYGGDATYAPSTSSTATETITVPATSTTLTASPNPATAGSAVTLTANVTSTGGTPTGPVTFLDGTTTLGTANLSGGQATLAVSTLAAGTHPLTASYAATAGFGASVSPVVSETVNAGNVLYVNNVGTCADSGTGAGTAAKPFCTIGAASKKATAGYTVVVAAGTYRESVTVANSGTAAAPITFTAAAGATVTLTGGTYGFTMSSKSWIVLRGFTVTATVSSGINVSGGTNVTIDGNHVTAVGQPVSGKTAVGIKLSSTTQALVVNNTTDHNSDAGVYMTGSNSNTIRNNVSYANARGYTRAAAGFDVRNGTGNQIYRNVSHDNEDSGFNAWTGTSYGSNAFFDNVAYSNGDHGIDVHNATDARVIANTIVGNYDSGIEATTSAGTLLANNVSINNGINSARTSGNIRIDKGSVATTTVNDDLVYLRVPGVMVDWNGVKYSSLAAFRTATGQESRGIEADPRFAASADFHLLAGSPAIDSANSGAPNQPATDFDGNARVDDPATANTGIGPIAYADRGAFEYRP